MQFNVVHSSFHLLLHTLEKPFCLLRYNRDVYFDKILALFNIRPYLRYYFRVYNSIACYHIFNFIEIFIPSFNIRRIPFQTVFRKPHLRDLPFLHMINSNCSVRFKYGEFLGK